MKASTFLVLGGYSAVWVIYGVLGCSVFFILNSKVTSFTCMITAVIHLLLFYMHMANYYNTLDTVFPTSFLGCLYRISAVLMAQSTILLCIYFSNQMKNPTPLFPIGESEMFPLVGNLIELKSAIMLTYFSIRYDTDELAGLLRQDFPVLKYSKLQYGSTTDSKLRKPVIV